MHHSVGMQQSLCPLLDCNPEVSSLTTAAKWLPYRKVILGDAPQEHGSHEGACVISMAAGLTALSEAACTSHKGTLRGRSHTSISSKVYFCLYTPTKQMWVELAALGWVQGELRLFAGCVWGGCGVGAGGCRVTAEWVWGVCRVGAPQRCIAWLHIPSKQLLIAFAAWRRVSFDSLCSATATCASERRASSGRQGLCTAWKNEQMNECALLYLAAYVLIVQLSQGPLVSSHKGIQAWPCQRRLGGYISICTPMNQLNSQQCILLHHMRQCCNMISCIIFELIILKHDWSIIYAAAS